MTNQKQTDRKLLYEQKRSIEATSGNRNNTKIPYYPISNSAEKHIRASFRASVLLKEEKSSFEVLRISIQDDENRVVRLASVQAY